MRSKTEEEVKKWSRGCGRQGYTRSFGHCWRQFHTCRLGSASTPNNSNKEKVTQDARSKTEKLDPFSSCFPPVFPKESQVELKKNSIARCSILSILKVFPPGKLFPKGLREEEGRYCHFGVLEALPARQYCTPQ